MRLWLGVQKYGQRNMNDTAPLVDWVFGIFGLIGVFVLIVMVVDNLVDDIPDKEE